MNARLALLPLSFAALAGLARADVLVVNDNGGTPYATIQAAVDAAQSGDIVTVEPGDYAGFIVDGKSLLILGRGPAQNSVAIRSTIVVRNLAADQTVTLSRFLTSLPFSSGAEDRDGLRLIDDAGAVRIQDASLRGAESQAALGTPEAVGGQGIFALNAADVVVFDSFLQGGRGSGSLPNGTHGGDGLHLQSSSATVWFTTLLGGDGGGFGYEPQVSGGKGGAAALTLGSTLFATGCTLHGGEGGWAGFNAGGPGGDGLVIDAASTVTQRADTLLPGTGGWDMDIQFKGPPGQALVNAGTLVSWPGVSPKLAANDAAPNTGETLSLFFDGGPAGLLLVSLDTGSLLLPHWYGVLQVSPPWLFGGVLAATSPITTATPAMPSGLTGLELWLQVAVPGAGLTNPLHLTLLRNGY